MLGQIDFRQAAGQHQPAVVGHHEDALPAGAQQAGDAFLQAVQLGGQVPGDLPPVPMTVLVDGAGFRPALAGRVASLSPISTE